MQRKRKTSFCAGMVGLLCGGNQELREDRAGEVEGLFPALWGWRRWLPDGLDSGRGASSLNSQRRCLTAQRGSCDVTITQIWQIRDASEFELEISLLIFFLDSWSRVWQSGSIKKCFSFPLYQYFLSNNPIKWIIGKEVFAWFFVLEIFSHLR